MNAHAPPPETPPPDALALGLGSLVYGIAMGAICLISAQIMINALVYRMDPSDYPTIDPARAGLIAAIGVGASFAWYRSWALDNLWQRGVIGVLAAVGAVLAGFLAAPIENVLGLAGMIAWLAVMIAVAIVGSRWADRGRRTFELSK